MTGGGFVRDRREERFHIGIASLGAAAYFLLPFITRAIVCQILLAVDPAVLQDGDALTLISLCAMYGVGFPGALLLFRLDRVPSGEKKTVSPFAFCGLFAVCFAFAIVGSWVGQGVGALLNLLFGIRVENPLDSVVAGAPFWQNLLFCGILAPIAEEWVFRRQMIDRLRRYGDLPAVLISGILFGLVHGNFYQFFYAAAVGVVFGLIYVAVGDVRVTVSTLR